MKRLTRHFGPLILLSVSVLGACASRQPLARNAGVVWREAPAPGSAPQTPSTAPAPAPAPAGDKVLERSILGALVGWSGGVALSLGVCRWTCGDDETDALLVAVAMGVAGGGVGSAILGCTATEERGCTSRVLPRSLLGSVAAVAASIGIGVATQNGIASWVTFAAVQGLVTSRAIR